MAHRVVFRVSSTFCMLAAAAALLAESGRAGASDPCDLLPTSMSKLDWVPNADKDVLCDINCAAWPHNVSKPSAPVPSGSVPNFKFTDSTHSACSFPQNVCRTNTVCPPGTTRANVGGVYKCQSKSLKTVTFNPRQACKNNTTPPPFQIDAIEGAAPTVPASNSCPQTGGTTFYVRGTNVGLADAASVIHGSGARAVLLAPDTACVAPSCTRIWIDVEASAQPGDRGLWLSLWNNRAHSEKSFAILPKKTSTCPAPAKTIVQGKSGSGSGSTGGAVNPGGSQAAATARVTGRRYCQNGQAKVQTSGAFSLSQVTSLSLNNVLDTTGCTSALTNMTTNGKYYFRQVGSLGLGREVSFTDASVVLTSGSWELYLNEGQSTAGKYAAY